MASRLVHKLILRPVWERCKNTKLLHNCSRSLSTNSSLLSQSQLEVELKKEANDNSITQWKLCAAVCLVRLPVLEDALTEFERKYLALREQLEYERSVYNDWELEDQKQQELIKAIEAGDKNPEDIDFRETKRDLEEKYESMFTDFQESVKTLDPDDADMHNVNRRPRDTLIYVTKQQLGNDAVWMLPRGDWSENESMKDSAQRALDKYCGAGVNAFFTSNAPSGFYKYKFPKGVREDHIGAKLFIYNAYLTRKSQTHAAHTFNPSTKDDQVLDHAWLARDELRSFMKPKYIAALDKTILKWP